MQPETPSQDDNKGCTSCVKYSEKDEPCAPGAHTHALYVHKVLRVQRLRGVKWFPVNVFCSISSKLWYLRLGNPSRLQKGHPSACTGTLLPCMRPVVLATDVM